MRDNNTFWFKHYATNWNSMEVESMMSVYGAEGYGFYYILLESLCLAPGNKINISKKGVLKALSKRMQCDEETASTFINDCVSEFELLSKDDDVIWAEYIMDSLEAANKRRETAKKGAEARWSKTTDKDDDDGFDEFWEAYGKKVGRSKAYSLWKKMTKVKRKSCMDYIPAYVKSRPDVQYRKNPETFLRNECWNDKIYDNTKKEEIVKNASSDEITNAFM